MKRKIIGSPRQLPSSVGSMSSNKSMQLPPIISDDEVSLQLPPHISDDEVSLQLPRCTGDHESPTNSELPLSIHTENAEDCKEDNSMGSDSDCSCSEDVNGLTFPASQGTDDEGMNGFDDANDPEPRMTPNTSIRQGRSTPNISIRQGRWIVLTLCASRTLEQWTNMETEEVRIYDYQMPAIPWPRRQKLRNWLDVSTVSLTWNWRHGYRCVRDRELMRARQLNEREAFGGAELAAVHYDLFECAAAKHCDLRTLT